MSVSSRGSSSPLSIDRICPSFMAAPRISESCLVTLGDGLTEEDLLVHDETDDMLGYILSRMFWPDYPVPIGVIRRVKKPTHHQLVAGQIELVRADKGEGVLRDLLFPSDTWEVS